VKQQVPAHNNALKELANALTPGGTMFLFEHVQKTFVELYRSCLTMKYSNFQSSGTIATVDTNSQLTLVHPSEHNLLQTTIQYSSTSYNYTIVSIRIGIVNSLQRFWQLNLSLLRLSSSLLQ